MLLYPPRRGGYRWERISEYFHLPATLEHIGLSTNGEYCFFAEQNDEIYAVIEVHSGDLIWQVRREQDYPPMPEWIENGHIEIAHGPVKGRYRIFGLEYDYPLMVDETLGIAITIDEHMSEAVLVELKTQQEFEWLVYERSDDATKHPIATFSDDGTTIAVLVGNAVTFFRHDLSPHPETQTLTNQYVPKHMSGLRWINIGGVNGVFEYPQHAGLSTDGQRFMLIEYDEFSYAVMDVTTQEVFWQSGMWAKRYTLPELTEWIKDGFVEIHEGEAAGRYRIFGTVEGKPLLTNPKTGQTIEVDNDNSQLILRNGATMQELQRLPYRPSDDWTFASFSDDGSIIVVFANHAVTFFALVQNLGKRDD